MVNRAKLVDVPIIEMLLAKKYKDSSIYFMKGNESAGDVDSITCISDGFKRTLNVKRNSSKYYKSPNFNIFIDKNKLSVFKDSLFAFIDEASDSIYMVEGAKLLQYILENPKNIKPSNYSENKVSVILPKSDIILLVSDSNHIIK
jgi:hypothetical protein